MGTTGFVDMLLYLKKRIKMILILTLVGIVAGYALARTTQTYTASVGLQFTYSGAEEQLDPLGGQLDVYEIMQPSLVSAALSEMGSDVSVEEVRNQLSVAPVVRASDTAAQEAKIALGETVEVTTTNYNVSYTCDGSLGSSFAQRFLYALLEQYDEYFSRQYLQMNRVPDFMSIVDVQSMDYMEICDYISNQLLSIIGKLDALVEENSDFTSFTTGLDFAAARAFYANVQSNQYNRLYANVRNQLLTKDVNLLIQDYQKRIEDMRLARLNSEDESRQAHDMVLTFYDQYKANNLYYQARTTQLETDNDSDNKNLVYDYDLSLMINTYDDILLRYVNSGVDATNYKHDTDYYTELIRAYENDTGSIVAKAAMLESADALIEEITQISAKYAELTNQMLSDYYGTKIANNLKYNMAVEVTPGVSTSMYMFIGMFIMLLMGCALAIIIEIVQLQLTRKKFELLNVQEDGTLPPELVNEMSPLEMAFYEQSLTGFSEFYLMYQPMVRDGKWEISETLVRWASKRFGQVSPDEFIAIAEKYKQMDRLGEWIMHQACAQSSKWRRGGIVSPIISVNYSVNQIESQSFIDGICRVLSDGDAHAEDIYLEISGGGEIDNVEAVAQKFTALKALGLRLTVDRFGESISSMRTLFDLPADMVKLDRRFMSALNDNGGKDAAFLREIISVCRDRDLTICACGVEEPWQAQKLAELGIEYQQGFYYSSPLPSDSYEQRWMTASGPAGSVPNGLTERQGV